MMGLVIHYSIPASHVDAYVFVSDITGRRLPSTAEVNLSINFKILP